MTQIVHTVEVLVRLIKRATMHLQCEGLSHESIRNDVRFSRSGQAVTPHMCGPACPGYGQARFQDSPIGGNVKCEQSSRKLYYRISYLLELRIKITIKRSDDVYLRVEPKKKREMLYLHIASKIGGNGNGIPSR